MLSPSTAGDTGAGVGLDDGTAADERLMWMLSFQVEDTEAFANRVQRAMAKTLNLSSMDLLEEMEIPDEV